MFTSLILCVLFAGSVVPNWFRQFDEYNSFAVMMTQEKDLHENARKICLENGGNLAIVKTRALLLFLKDLIKEHNFGIYFNQK